MIRPVLGLAATAGLVLTAVYVSSTLPSRAQSYSPACIKITTATWVGTQCISTPATKFWILDGVCNNFGASTETGPAHGTSDMMGYGGFNDDSGGAYEWTGTFEMEQLPDGSCM